MHRLRWARPRADDLRCERRPPAHLSARSQGLAAAARGHHHGRQRALGQAARTCRASRATGTGAESARAIIRAAGELGIKYLTLYAFSVENWNRPKDEVDTLMKYLVHYLKTETPELNKNNVRLEVIGQIYRLPEIVQEQLQKVHRHARRRTTA